jgi:hypothetical protein
VIHATTTTSTRCPDVHRSSTEAPVEESFMFFPCVPFQERSTVFVLCLQQKQSDRLRSHVAAPMPLPFPPYTPPRHAHRTLTNRHAPARLGLLFLSLLSHSRSPPVSCKLCSCRSLVARTVIVLTTLLEFAVLAVTLRCVRFCCDLNPSECT